MSGDRNKQGCRAVGFRSFELWAIVGAIFLAGVSIGYPLGEYLERGHGEARLESVRHAYNEALQAKEDSVRMCLIRATEAAEKAEKALEEVKQ